MTVFDASLKLYQWYTENDVFSMEDHFKQIVLLSEDLEQDMAAFKAALKSLKETNIIAIQKIENKTYYILVKRLDSLDQEITINHLLALKMANQINDFCVRINDFADVVDPTKLTQRDVYNLTFIIEYFLKEEDEKKD